jgi:hypothetical protein
MSKTKVVVEPEEDDDALQKIQRPVRTHEYGIGDLS